MTDLTFYDAAFPPAEPPATDGVCVYIGGDAVHVWTLEEIGMQPARYRLPVFVRSNPPGPGAAQDVASGLSRLRAIGAPRRTLVAWDMETAADALYIRGVSTGLANGGYKLIVYGSESTVRGNQVPDGLIWGADWTSVPHLHSGDAMTQYVSFSGFDEELARPGLPFWDTQAPVHKGPYRHVAPGNRSLAQIAAARSTTPQHLAEVTMTALTPGDVADIAQLRLPAGFPWYSTNP